MQKVHFLFSLHISNIRQPLVTSCVLQSIVLRICLSASSEAFRNCLSQRYFTSKGRGIGYSFQLAITAPLYSITGYCIATAQSYPTVDLTEFRIVTLTIFCLRIVKSFINPKHNFISRVSSKKSLNSCVFVVM